MNTFSFSEKPVKMKKVIIIIFVAVFMQSCTELAFRNAMPMQGTDIMEFPEEMQGTFLSMLESKDTIVITAKDVSGDKFHIDDHNVLRKFGKYYICNEKKSDRWVIGVIRPQGHRGFTVYRFDVEESKKREAIAGITKVEEVLDESGGVDYLLVSPTDAEFRKMLRSKAFIRAEKFRRVKG